MTIDLTTMRDYLKVPATILPDPDLQRMLDAAHADQAARCTVPDPPTTYDQSALDQAILRRVQREVAAKNLPLGMIGLDAEYGPAALAMYDALVEQHERAYRSQVLA